MKKLLFVLLFGWVVCSVSAQNIRTTADAVGVSYSVDPSSIEQRVHHIVPRDLGTLGALINDELYKIRAKEKSISLVAYLPKDHNYNETMINQASERAHVIREKLKSLYGLNNDDFVFAFDDRNDVRDLISVDVVERGMYHRGVIYYSTSNNLETLDLVVDKYNGVPFYPAGMPSFDLVSDKEALNRSYNNYVAKNHQQLEVVVISSGKLKNKEDKSNFKTSGPFFKNSMAPILSLKINALALAGFTPYFKQGKVMPNLEVEGYLSNFFSLSVSGAYMKYYKGEVRDCQKWRVGNVSFEPRFWLNNRKAFRGVYLGVYGEYTNFDILNPNIASGARVDGEGFSTGLAVGYYQNIVGGLGIEAAVRGGYVDYTYDRYVTPDHKTREHKSTVDLTQVRVSIVYRFGKRDVLK